MTFFSTISKVIFEIGKRQGTLNEKGAEQTPTFKNPHDRHSDSKLHHTNYVSFP